MEHYPLQERILVVWATSIPHLIDNSDGQYWEKFKVYLNISLVLKIIVHKRLIILTVNRVCR